MRFHFLNSVKRGGGGSGGDSIDASGGTITTETINGIDYKIHTFDVVGSDTFVINSISGTVTLEYLIVAGGGGAGGLPSDGAGGAGGLLQGTLQKSDNTDISVTVGGADSTNFGVSGTDSAFGATTATGGGAGGIGFTKDGEDGGSGGGGAGFAAGGLGIAGQGHDGADGQAFNGGGGGGGATSAGSNSNGGSGLLSDFNGTSIEYAQGGTVGGTTASTPGSGGATSEIGRDGIVIVRYEV